jgi:hypothetical protein
MGEGETRRVKISPRLPLSLSPCLLESPLSLPIPLPLSVQRGRAFCVGMYYLAEVPFNC